MLNDVNVKENEFEICLKDTKTKLLGDSMLVNAYKDDSEVCAHTALKAWLKVRGCEEGPLMLYKGKPVVSSSLTRPEGEVN